MSWLEEFEAELLARRVRPAMRDRLLAELGDHIACGEGARAQEALGHLGAAPEIAGHHADELAADETRRGVFAAFAALVTAAIALGASQLALGRIGYPGFDHGYSTPLALIAIAAFVLGSLVALVAWRALRRRGAAVLPAAEIALVRRRASIGLIAGLVTTAGLLLYVANSIGVLPAWWPALSGSLAAACVALVASHAALARSAATVVLASGPAGDLFDDIPPLRVLRGHPLRLCALAALGFGTVMTLVEWNAEHSLQEGLQRGVAEALALSVAFALLGRAIGARRRARRAAAAARPALHTSSVAPIFTRTSGATMTLPVEGYQLKRISSKAYEHPADRAATASLQAIPYLDRVVRKLIELGYERALRQAALGSAVRLGEDQLPNVWRLHERAYRTLDIDPVPDLYLTQFPFANASTIGSGRPMVVLQSALVKLLNEEQLYAVLAHEAGHVLSDHVLYGTALAIISRLSRLPGIPLPLMPLRAALLEWQRSAELTCDRAAALVTRDPLTVCRVLMVIAAGAEAKRLDLDVFMKQGQEYREKGSGLERLSRLLLDLGVTHPMPVRRIHELMDWVASGEYDRIVGGSYVSRDEPPRPRAEAGDAVSHYAERFKSVFRDAGESIADVGNQVSEWLRGSGDGTNGHDAEDDARST